MIQGVSDGGGVPVMIVGRGGDVVLRVGYARLPPHEIVAVFGHAAQRVARGDQVAGHVVLRVTDVAKRVVELSDPAGGVIVLLRPEAVGVARSGGAAADVQARWRAGVLRPA